MSESQYKKLISEYRRKDRLYPDRGRSIRPWEAPLRAKIRACIDAGLRKGAAWARKAKSW